VAERRGPAGVGEHGTFIVGSYRNLGGPVVSVDEPVLGNPVNNPWPVWALRFAPLGAKFKARDVARCEGN
jgi:hypothetical protein